MLVVCGFFGLGVSFFLCVSGFSLSRPCELIDLFKYSVCMTLILCAPACALVSFGLFVPALGVSGSFVWGAGLAVP